MNRSLVACGVLALAGCLSMAAWLQADDRGTAESRLDHKFIHEAGMGGMAEVKMGQLAADQATNPEVRRFGQRMVDDHSRANREFMSILERKGLEAPKGLGMHHRELMERLSKMTGAEFDRDYMTHMIKDHEEDVELFEKEARDGQDPDLKAFAEKTLPIIQEHLRMARDLSRALEGSR